MARSAANTKQLDVVVTAFTLTLLLFSPVRGGCPLECRQELLPVCGTDGAVYSNACELGRLNCERPVTVAKKECSSTRGDSCQAFCGAVYDPVCGTDGNTYNNSCVLMAVRCRKDVQFAHFGSCTNMDEDDECPKTCEGTEWRSPVCGSDGNVYQNKCELKLQNCGVRVVPTSPQHCQSTRYCHDSCRDVEPRPVCASDGKIYTHGCEMKQKNCGKHVYEVPMTFCLELEDCPRQCWEAKPVAVCGSDGSIYNSECEMQMLTCGSSKPVRVVNMSDCAARLELCDRNRCSSRYEPICGSDGRTYSNICQLNNANCKKGVRVAHSGVCHSPGMAEVCPDQCPPSSIGEDGPVCGSDGNVYKNACELKRRTCGQKVVPVHRKNCPMTTFCDTRCPNVSRPVCSSDLNLYRSECHMHSKNCGKHVFQVPLDYCLRRVFKKCFEICPRAIEPVCGTDLKTYSNDCFLRIETCRSKGRVRRAYYGKCGLPLEAGVILDPLSKQKS